MRCLLGNLWITEEGNHEDKIIGNGESFVLDRHGLSLVTALGGPALLVVRRAPSLLHIHCGMRRKRMAAAADAKTYSENLKAAFPDLRQAGFVDLSASYLYGAPH